MPFALKNMFELSPVSIAAVLAKGKTQIYICIYICVCIYIYMYTHSLSTGFGRSKGDQPATRNGRRDVAEVSVSRTTTITQTIVVISSNMYSNNSKNITK